ncbi:hypothetical protein LUZ60_001051 [Juncus effusus]|nr:hypothetical protein LUZ60_001051 [Juncus effusus]
MACHISISTLTLLVFLLNPFFLPISQALNNEGQALLSFKQSISQDPENSFSNWNRSDSDPCNWNGVTCKQNRVFSLSLPRKRLLGFIPSSIGSLPFLRHVNLRNNQLFGQIPTGLFSPLGLQSLVLYGNFLHGSLPPEIGTLSYLQILDLSFNSINGSLPNSILSCKRLKTLVLSHNNFTNSVPTGLGMALTELEKLDLSYNQFSGSIPTTIGNLSSLQGTVDFSHNQFSGLIPQSLGNLPEKVYIDLTYNNFSGPIPQNGALENRGPTAFIGNPNLCGPPLKDPCNLSESPSLNPFLPSNYSQSGVNVNTNKNRGLSKIAIIAIVVSDIIGIALIALFFFYCYWRAVSSKSNKEKTEGQNGNCPCFGRLEESDSLSETNNENQYELVKLDKGVEFNLDELLKASAFVLGKSGIGIVYKIVLENGPALAVRRLGEGGLQRFKEFQTEVDAIGKVRHTNIVALRAYYWSYDEKLLVYDYIPNGSLSSAIHGKTGAVSFSPIQWDIRLKIIKGTAKGLQFLHEFSPKKYVHGDLKPNNILLSQNFTPHISDFGLARLATIAGNFSPYQSDRNVTGTETKSDASVSPLLTNKGNLYQAPEALKTLKPSQKWDVYSFGVILLELITGRAPMVLLDNLQMDLVKWVEICIEEKKPLLDVLDPCLVRELEREDEIIAVLKIALNCVLLNPERRPVMRSVVDALERIERHIV